MRLEERYSDVLENIESVIVGIFEINPKLADRQVITAIDSLIAFYELEKRNRTPSKPTHSGQTRIVFDGCFGVCEWRLGRQSLENSESIPAGELSVSEMYACLKRLRKSMRLWHKRDGKQGYLNYVRQFITDANSQIQI